MKCRERVYRGRSYGDTHCSREAGYGPGGEYCKQHAKNHEPPPVANGPKIYTVTENYHGEVSITETPIIKETDCFYMIPKEAEKDWGWTSRVEKALASLSKEDAVARFVKKHEKRIDEKEKQIISSQDAIKKAQMLIRQNANPEK